MNLTRRYFFAIVLTSEGLANSSSKRRVDAFEKQLQRTRNDATASSSSSSLATLSQVSCMGLSRDISHFAGIFLGTSSSRISADIIICQFHSNQLASTTGRNSHNLKCVCQLSPKQYSSTSIDLHCSYSISSGNQFVTVESGSIRTSELCHKTSRHGRAHLRVHEWTPSILSFRSTYRGCHLQFGQ